MYYVFHAPYHNQSWVNYDYLKHSTSIYSNNALLAIFHCIVELSVFSFSYTPQRPCRVFFLMLLLDIITINNYAAQQIQGLKLFSTFYDNFIINFWLLGSQKTQIT